MGYFFYKGKQYADEVLIDSTLSTTSGNAVQNKVVATNINTINDELDALDTNKQAKLVSGQNIKTINSTSILGSGDIEIQGSSYSAGAGIEIQNSTIKVTDTVRNGAASGATSLQPSDVVNNVTSTGTAVPLSANMGKELQDQINNLKNIGRFLSIWNSATGLPTTNPTTLPYTYKTGDYYRVGTVDETTNYKPNGSTYDGTASTTTESEDVEVGWVYYYDGSTWKAQSGGGGGTVQDVQVDETSIIDSGTGIANINIDDSTLTFNASTKTLSGYRYTVTVM